MKAKGEDERELTKASYAAVNAEVAGPGVLQNVDIVDVSTIASQDSVSDSRAFGCQNIVGSTGLPGCLAWASAICLPRRASMEIPPVRTTMLNLTNPTKARIWHAIQLVHDTRNVGK